jgi:5-hydroxyisourate hydrolase
MKLSTGVYKLIFHTGEYFKTQDVTTLYPFVEVCLCPFRSDPDRRLDSNAFVREKADVQITFNYSDPTQHYHIPLLVSPWSYTTYRGS